MVFSLLASGGPNDAPPFFTLLTVVFMGIIAIALILAHFRQSLLAGYFICGVILANCGILDHIPNSDVSIQALSEVGIILLMFTLGLEFSVDELKHLRKTALVGGGIQMFICTAAFGLGLHYATGMDMSHSLTVGAIMGLSSTAVALKSFQEFGLSGTSGAKMAVGIALFQDIAAIMLVAIMPQIFTVTPDSWETALNIGMAVLRGLVFLGAAWLIGRYLLPRIMLAVARTKSRELFTLMVFAICSGIAMLASLLGLSIALGAFTAGLFVSGSYYSHRVLSEVLPFKDLFLTIFFVSAGLLIDIDGLWQHIGQVATFTAFVLAIKFIACLTAASFLKIPGRMGIMASTALTNVGEFSLVLIPFMQEISPIPALVTTNVYAIAAVSMGMTPLLMKAARKLTPLLVRIPGLKTKRERLNVETLITRMEGIREHAIICGYGPVGRRLHESLSQYGIPCIIIDLNADTVKSLLNEGHLAFLGDIQHQITMDLAGVRTARLIAFTFPDPAPALSTYMQIKGANGDITVIARAKFRSEVASLHHAGIVNVIHDEMETGAAAVRLAKQSFDIIEPSDAPSLSH
ncbi:cation:proton antiporter [Akkermansia muciniphila]|uniref:cation:proton antiporter n=1 Tax=Akkermansia muciniphila TaxID=239935 RepID=UPI000B8EADDC|nr:cation:proton antiporter [Akkermansia muciniphila]WMB14335.1 cation:proton antiporter [Akkermansia muciniphila]WMB18775.1 cation:proton antiporter [Akkermansia muciniphila]